MVSFQCEGCADTVKKPQLDKHRNRCWAPFTCLDCSTTFQNQDYKNHTSCISEAEKYQGALYKGAKKTAAPVVVASAPIIAPEPTPVPATSTPAPAPAIHPSRLNQLAAPSPSFAPSGRGGRGGGRGGFGGRGGGGGGGGAAGGYTRYSATGENSMAPQGGMRSWGSNANSEAGDAESSTPLPIINGNKSHTTFVEDAAPTSTSTFANAAGEDEGAKKKKNKKKGDKKGTGSRANTRNPPKAESEVPSTIVASASLPIASSTATSTTNPTEEPIAKKRKRSASPSTTTFVEPSQKTVKKLRKTLSKLSDQTEKPLRQSLEGFLATLGSNKNADKTIDASEILKAVKVELIDGKWQLTV
ncbi:cell growth-regulating nucleolar protein, partial [Tremellales sp. Uapishka_1]